MNGKTLVEIAVEFNIEINKLRNKINYEKRKGNSLGLKKYGALYFSESDIEQLKEMFNIVEKPVEFNNGVTFFKTQLEEKDRQISKLQQALNQQQIWTKKAQDQSQNLLLENTEMKEKLAEENSKSWFQKLFRK